MVMQSAFRRSQTCSGIWVAKVVWLAGCCGATAPPLSTTSQPQPKFAAEEITPSAVTIREVRKDL